MFINWSIDTQNESTHTREYNSVTKGQSTDTCYHMDNPQKHCTKSNKPGAKDFILYDSISMKYAEKTHLQRQRAVHQLPGTKNRNIDGLKTGSPGSVARFLFFFFSKKKRFYLIYF